MNGINNYSVIGLDSNIFIYQFEDNPVFSHITDSLFLHISQNKKKAITSIISLIEALSFPAPKDVLSGIEESFKTIPQLTVVEVHSAIALDAARIRRTYGLRLPDAIQLATCLEVKADVFITNDKKLPPFPEITVLLLADMQ